jgi:imidazolonepropionase-like amidohydrolase
VTRALHLRGPILIGPDQVRSQAWVLGDRLSFSAPTAPGTRVDTLAGWVLPGLVDAHAHVGLDAHGEVDREGQERQAIADRDIGGLLLRDAGSPVDTRWIDERADLPRVVRAGRHVARTHRYLRGVGEEVEPADLPAQVREQARRGDGWVKIVGDWIDRDVGDLAPCWPADALAAAVRAAHEEGARITAHCFGEECLPDLLAAGVDGIEHGTGLGSELFDQVARQRIAVVPTLVNIANFPRFAADGERKFPRYAARMRALHQRRYRTIADAHAAGVRLYCGTDAGGNLPHGLLAREVAELTRAGLPPLAALDAACWSARAWLGFPGLEEGAPADLVMYPGDPRQDVGVLAAPSAVVLRGRRVA